MSAFYLLSGYLVFSLVAAQQTPQISHVSSNKVVRVGETIDMRCSVQYAANYPVIWSKVSKENPSNNFLISQGSSLSISDNRYSIRHDEASSTYTLQLSKIQESDSGIFQCQLQISSTSRVTANVIVTVLIPPVINDEGSNVITTSPRSSISLECYATGNPKPIISWRRQNNELLPTGSEVYLGNILRIHNVTKNDRGTYYCLANNDVGKPVKRNFLVEVKFAPEVSVPKEMHFQATGYPVDIECHIKGYPTPLVQWIKNGVRIYDDKDYHVTMDSPSLDTIETTLRINAVTSSHFGKYICRGNNDFGSSEKIIEVAWSRSPVCPPACDVNGVFSSLKLSNYLSFVSIVAICCFFSRNCS